MFNFKSDFSPDCNSPGSEEDCEITCADYDYHKYTGIGLSPRKIKFDQTPIPVSMLRIGYEEMWDDRKGGGDIFLFYILIMNPAPESSREEDPYY